MAQAVDWSSLPSELVSRVADVFLATSDVDYYASIRAVCRNWRAATDDPRGPDPRFRPRRWVMLDELVDPYTVVSRLFLNVETGRFLRRDNLPAICYYYYIASADGLLVLRCRGSENRLCVLNPLTGHVVRFHVNVQVLPREVILAVTGSSPMVLTLFFCDPCHGACFEPVTSSVDVKSPPMFRLGSDLASGDFGSVFTAAPALDCVCSVVSFRGRVYAADRAGSIAAVDYSGPHMPPEITVLVAGGRRPELSRTFLVDNVGEELLLVRASWSFVSWRGMEVFRVDLARSALEPVRSIGKNRALVIGFESICVDSGKVHGFEGNCIYYSNGFLGKTGIYVYRVEDVSKEMLAAHPGDEGRRNGLDMDRGRVFPLPLAQVLVISAWPHVGEFGVRG